jgi:hypothetical protein
MTHKQRILENVQSLSNLTATAIDKIDKNLYIAGARKMLDTIGTTAYSEYVALQSNSAVVSEIEDEDYAFENSSDDGRKLKDLELSEAYFVLFFLSLALRRIDIDVFMTEMETWGEGRIDPVDIDKLLAYGDKYLKEGRIIAMIYGSSSGLNVDEDGLISGNIGVFAV